MGPARIAVLVIAAVAAIGAALVMRSIMSGSAPEPAIVAEPREETPTVAVLTAARDLAPGERVAPEDLTWSQWPEAAVGPSFILQSSEPDAIETYSGAVARTVIASAEPVSPGKIVMTGEAGFMSAVLAPGMRAVAIPISVESGAGGFILPNDRVDVLVTRDTGGSSSTGTNANAVAFVTETILTNVRVLAIDQIFRDTEGQQVVVGSTATLEVAPREAEMIAQADAAGDVSLALRSLADSIVNADEQRAAGAMQSSVSSTVQVYQYGAVSRVAVHEPMERAQ